MKNPILKIENGKDKQIQSAFLTKSEFNIYAFIINIKSKYLDYRIHNGAVFDENNKVTHDKLEIHFEGADDVGESIAILEVEKGYMNKLHRFEEYDGDQLIIQFIPTEMLIKDKVIASVKDE